jgi:hypothetical protein
MARDGCALGLVFAAVLLVLVFGFFMVTLRCL